MNPLFLWDRHIQCQKACCERAYRERGLSRESSLRERVVTELIVRELIARERDVGELVPECISPLEAEIIKSCYALFRQLPRAILLDLF